VERKSFFYIIFFSIIAFFLLLSSCAGTQSVDISTIPERETEREDRIVKEKKSIEEPSEKKEDKSLTKEKVTEEPTEKKEEKTPSPGTRESKAGETGAITEDDWVEDIGHESNFTLSESTAPSAEAGAPDAAFGASSFLSGSRPGVSGLRAGFADDNRQYGYFLRFLKEYGYVPHYPIPVEERIILAVKDKDGKSLQNATVTVIDDLVLERGKTLADGSYLFFPSEYRKDLDSYVVRVEWMQQVQDIELLRNGERQVEITFPIARFIENPVPMDILFVFDTTGSMGEEIQRLKTTIELIHLNLTSIQPRPNLRLGMVLYKDVGDEYRTRVIPLTENLEDFRQALSLVEASGGGDHPEDLQAALEEAVKNIDWNKNGIRMAFIITDASPHLDYGQTFTYVDSARKAKELGIKFFTVGTGGLDITGEYILRQISQYTSGKYIFLTYGETGESEGGRPGSVSHHTGANYSTDKLEAIIIRFAREELSYLTDTPLQEAEPYFAARKIEAEEREETLKKLFSLTLEQLVDYSSISISENTPTAVLPITAAGDESKVDAEYFTEQLLVSVSENNFFRPVERKDLQKIMEELKLQLSGITGEEDAAELGRVLNARLLVSGRLYAKEDNYELFLKLLWVETGEVLSVTKAVIQKKLGLKG